MTPWTTRNDRPGPDADDHRTAFEQRPYEVEPSPGWRVSHVVGPQPQGTTTSPFSFRWISPSSGSARRPSRACGSGSCLRGLARPFQADRHWARTPRPFGVRTSSRQYCHPAWLGMEWSQLCSPRRTSGGSSRQRMRCTHCDPVQQLAASWVRLSVRVSSDCRIAATSAPADRGTRRPHRRWRRPSSPGFGPGRLLGVEFNEVFECLGGEVQRRDCRRVSHSGDGKAARVLEALHRHLGKITEGSVRAVGAEIVTKTDQRGLQPFDKLTADRPSESLP